MEKNLWMFAGFLGLVFVALVIQRILAQMGRDPVGGVASLFAPPAPAVVAGA